MLYHECISQSDRSFPLFSEHNLILPPLVWIRIWHPPFGISEPPLTLNRAALWISYTGPKWGTHTLPLRLSPHLNLKKKKMFIYLFSISGMNCLLVPKKSQSESPLFQFCCLVCSLRRRTVFLKRLRGKTLRFPASQGRPLSPALHGGEQQSFLHHSGYHTLPF